MIDNCLKLLSNTEINKVNLYEFLCIINGNLFKNYGLIFEII